MIFCDLEAFEKTKATTITKNVIAFPVMHLSKSYTLHLFLMHTQSWTHNLLHSVTDKTKHKAKKKNVLFPETLLTLLFWGLL